MMCVDEIYATDRHRHRQQPNQSHKFNATKSRVCSIGNFSLDISQAFSKSNCASEVDQFLNVWNPKLHEIFVKTSTIKDVGKINLNSGGNCLYHSFAIWMMLKKLKENNEIDSYVESGVWKGKSTL